jgi:hypothetical protein
MDGNSHVQMWATAISTHSGNGRKIIFRYAKDFSPTFERASQPDRIIIVWRYQSETGQPVQEEHEQMDLLEDSLEQHLKEDQFATLALVSTGENLREWTYYTKSEDEFMDRLNVALDGMKVFPVEIHTAHDPTWSMYSEFRAGVRDTQN